MRFDLAPGVLQPQKYEAVGNRMLHINPYASSAACIVMPRAPKIDTKSVGLGAQLHDVLYRTSELTLGMTDEKPRAFLVTADSAVPVADALKEALLNLGLDAIPVGLIHANQGAAINYKQLGNDPDHFAAREMRREAARIGEELGLTVDDHVCIVDQWVSSGNTIRYGKAIVNAAGADFVTAIRGQWYEQASSNDLDVPNLTSVHAPFMQEIGARAAEQVFQLQASHLTTAGL